MADALEMLIAERHAKAPKNKCFSDFLTMKHDIDNLKQDAAAPPVTLVPGGPWLGLLIGA